MRRSLTIAAVSVLGLIAARADAQVSSAMDVSTGLRQPTTSAWVRESRLAPTLQLVGPLGSLDLVSELSERPGGFGLLRAGIDGRITSGAFGGGRFRLALEGSAASDTTAQLIMFGAPQPTATA